MSVSIDILRVRREVASLADVEGDDVEDFGPPAEVAACIARRLPGCVVAPHATKSPFDGMPAPDRWTGVNVDAETNAAHEVDFVLTPGGEVASVVVRPPAGGSVALRAALHRVVSAVAGAVGGVPFSGDGERFRP